MGNPTVDLLEKCKNDLRRTYDNYLSTRNDSVDFNLFLDDKDFRKARLIIFKLCEKKSIEKPQELINSRNVEELILTIHFDTSDYAEALNLISTLFNSFIDDIEMKSIDVQIVHIKCEVPEELSYNHILEDISKCENRVETGDYSGALTSARSLIEGVCKEIIYNIEGQDVEGSPNLPKLFKRVRNHLNLDPSNEALHQSLQQVISGLIQVVQGLNEVRNIGGDGHTRKVSPSLHHALLVVNSAKTVVNFLFDTYEYQRKLGKIHLSEVVSSQTPN
ncbi:abortive infection family protein [Priestia megaterium]|uniref:abortive infection family protein n=1 Tax=Priestia megaterium TaxID=1404 RepID=UPI0035BE38D8